MLSMEENGGMETDFRDFAVDSCRMVAKQRDGHVERRKRAKRARHVESRNRLKSPLVRDYRVVAGDLFTTK